MVAGQPIRKADLLIEKNRIAKIAPGISAPGVEVIEADGLLAMPGFVQTHIHLCQTLFRNLANDLELLDWLKKRIWPLEAAHTESSLAISARLGLLELIKSGTTAILDMGSVYRAETILNEVAKAGLRASVGVTFMDEGEDVPEELKRPFAESLNYAEKLAKTWHGAEDGRIRINLAPRFALSCSEDSLRTIAETARELGLMVHTHASENRKEVEQVRISHGMGNVEYYHKLGMTGDHLALAHCIWLSEREIGILAETGTRVLHCPSSNLKLGSGIANIPRYRQRGILCSLGADGAPCNNNLSAFTEMRLAALIQKPIHGPKVLPAREVVQMATSDGARALHWQEDIGTLEEGKKADLILLDLRRPHTEPNLFTEWNDLYAQLVYAASGENVQTVIVDGKVLMQNRKVLTIDEGETLALARKELEQLIGRANLRE